MCLLLVAWKVHPLHDLVLAANRDELHDRATGALDHWPDLPGVAGGRDLVAGGTWLAAHRDGRFATVTNYRGGESLPGSGPSRGALPVRYLAGNTPPADYVDALARDAAAYAGFNLLIGDAHRLWYVSNRAPGFARELPPGIYGLSNELLDTPWPKVALGIEAMRAHVDAGGSGTADLFAALARRDSAASDLPWPASSGPFIAHERFGTRATTLLRRARGGLALVEERRFGPMGNPQGATQLRLAPASGAMQ